MQQLELLPELTTTESYIGVEFTDGEDVYVSSPAIELFGGGQFGCRATCLGCAFDFDLDGSNCWKSSETVSCVDNPIIWIKKG